MATANCTYGGFAHYNGGYTPENGYMNDSSGGYIGDGSGYGYVAKINIPAAAGAADGRSLTITLGLMTLYYSDFTLEYWITNEGRPAGPNYGEGPPPIKGTQLIHGTVNVNGVSSSDWTYKTFTTGATSSLSASGGAYYLWLRCNRNAVAGGGTAPKFVLNYTAITPCTPPTSLSATPSLFEGEVSLAWAGAGAGVSNPIAGYDIYYRDSANGSSWGGWLYLKHLATTATSGEYTYSPGIGRGTYRQHRIFTIGQAGDGYHSPAAEFQAVKKNSLPTAPSNLTVSETVILSGTNVTLSWPKVSDPDGNFARYRVERTQNNGGSWQAVTTTTDTSAKQAVNVPDGSKVQYRVRSEDALGAVSAFVYSSVISVISLCSPPSSISVTPSVFETAVTLSWSEAKGGSFNTITGVQIEYSTSSNGTTWGGWTLLTTVKTTLSSGNYKYNPSLTRGHRIRYRVRVTGSAGAIGYSPYSSTVSTKKNALPTAPTTLTVSDSAPSLGDEITVTWAGADDPDDNIAGYELYIKGKLIQTIETSEKNGTALISLPDTIADGETAALSIITVDAYQCKSPSKSVNITRTDRAVYMGSGNGYPRCQVFIGSGSQWKKAQLLYGINGEWQKILAGPVTVPEFRDVPLKGKEITRNVTASGLPIQGKLYGATTNPVHTEVTVTNGGELKQMLKLSGKEPEEKQGSLIQFDDAESGTDMQITAESGSVVRCGRNLLNYNQADFAGMDIYLPPGDYSTFGESDTGTTQLNIQFTYADGTNSNQAIINSGVNKSSRAFHIDQPVSRISSIYEVPGTGEARTNIRLQLEAGTEVHSYEAYTGNTLEAGQSIAIPVLDGMNSVFSGSGNNIQVQYLKASAPLSMGGVIVDTGENYTDSIGQKWICDEFDFTSQTLTKRVRNGAVLDQPETLTKDLTGYPPQLVSWAGTMILACSGGEMALDFKEAAE